MMSSATSTHKLLSSSFAAVQGRALRFRWVRCRSPHSSLMTWGRSRSWLPETSSFCRNFSSCKLPLRLQI